MTPILRRLFAAGALLLTALPLLASDLEQERRWARELQGVGRIGEIRLIAPLPEPPAAEVEPPTPAAETGEPAAATADGTGEPAVPADGTAAGSPIEGKDDRAAEPPTPDGAAGATEGEAAATPPAPAAPEFFAIYAEQTLGQRKGAVLLLHDLGTHPDWPEVIAPLRERLPAFGFSTLAIQLPLSEPNSPANIPSLVSEAAPRIQAAIAELRQEGYERIAVVGYGLGALMGAAYLAEQPEPGVIGFAAIGVEEYAELPAERRPAGLWPRLGLPLLDIIGSRESESVLAGAAAREVEARRKGVPAAQQGESLPGERPLSGYRLLRVAGADHGFTGLEDVLTRRLRGWLEQALDAYAEPAPQGEETPVEAPPGAEAPVAPASEEPPAPAAEPLQATPTVPTAPAEGAVAPQPASTDNLGESSPWR